MGHFLAGISAANRKESVELKIRSSLVSLEGLGCAPRERGLICFKFFHVDKKRIKMVDLLFISDL